MASFEETVSMNESLEHDSVLSGTPGEHLAQTRFGSAQRAQAFYRQQVFPKLNDAMQRFVLK